MKPIQKQSFLFECYIPKPIPSAGVYRPSQFLFWDDVHSCLFHTLTRAIVCLNDLEYAILKQHEIRFSGDDLVIRALIEGWFLVPVDFNEAAFYREVYEMNLLISPEDDRKSLYKIFTTTACNARCYYCFEAGTPISTMSPDTAEQVVKYILNTKRDKEIKLYWFGGEPLCNTRVISQICSSLQELNVPFTSDMISNGLLFNDDLISEAVSLWKLQLCQITLDGTAEEYKRIKAYVGNEDNPFDKVINNITRLLDAGVSVRIRLNIDRSNISDINRLKDFLLKRFVDYQNLSIYAAAISADWLGYHDPSEPERNSTLGEALATLRKALEGKTEGRRFYLSDRLPVTHCMANSRHAVVINPEGDLYTCQGCDKHMCYGNIWEGVLLPDIYEAWKNNAEAREQCRSCVWLPECTAFSKCPSIQPNCKQIKEARMRHRMKNTLEKLL